jgi:hypothetical protein
MIRISSFILFLFVFTACSHKKNDPEVKKTSPRIFPDYTNVTIPSNIAPMNFYIEETGKKFIVRFFDENNKGFKIVSGSPLIKIPSKKWSDLLKRNTAKKIFIEISSKESNNKWTVYEPFYQYIASQHIDNYIVFRRINTSLFFWNDMSIVQRNISNFSETHITNNKNFNNGCIHCHSFSRNNSENFLLHFRRKPSGTLIKNEDKLYWLDSKTKYTLSGFVYPSWHPGGKLIAFSTNTINQDFYASGHRINYVRDVASDIVIYDIEKKLIFTSPEIASKDFENLPNWSPDGKYLYFTRMPHKLKNLPDTLVKYDLVRIPFDEKTGTLGKAEVLLTSSETNMSISFPEASPDGKFIVFCMADYGYFTIGNPTSDLYIMDVVTLDYRKLNINSDYSESFHNWSENGRWLVFASKRIDGLITLPFFSYFDENGNESKPFVLPVEDPSTLKTNLFNYNRPVFVTNKIGIKQDDIMQFVKNKPDKVSFDTINVDIDAIAGPTAPAEKRPENGNPYMEN